MLTEMLEGFHDEARKRGYHRKVRKASLSFQNELGETVTLKSASSDHLDVTITSAKGYNSHTETWIKEN